MTSSSSSLAHVTDRELMTRLREIACEYRGVTVELLMHLAEVDARRLCGAEAEGTLFNHCVKILNFSEGEACKRIAAARAARKYPVILDLVSRGDLHLTAVSLLAPHLTDENHRELLEASVRKTKRQILELLAAWFPKPDAPTLLRRLPEPARARLQPPVSEAAVAAGPAGVGATTAGDTRTAAPTGTGEPITVAADSGRPAAAVVAPASPRISRFALDGARDRGSVVPLSPGRYKLQVTVSQDVRDKLLRAQGLLRHVQPDGDLAVVLNRALSLLVEELERRKLGRLKKRQRVGEPTEQPSAPAPSARPQTRRRARRSTGEPPLPAAADRDHDTIPSPETVTSSSAPASSARPQTRRRERRSTGEPPLPAAANRDHDGLPSPETVTPTRSEPSRAGVRRSEAALRATPPAGHPHAADAPLLASAAARRAASIAGDVTAPTHQSRRAVHEALEAPR